MSDSKRCKACGNPVDLEQAKDGACPWCLAAFTFSPEPVGNPVTATKDSAKQFGKYVRTEKLGAGGMGEVWKALDTELNRWVALKFLKDEDPSVVLRFQREAKTAASLTHSNIAAIYEVGEIDGRHYIAMQYVPGRTMASFPRNDRGLIVRLFRDAARGLEHAHHHGVIHRDLKPDNLMVEEKEQGWSVMILDFGLARAIEGGDKLSQSGEVYGTAPYMSPEQARGERLDERADVYGLGATMYEVLTGKAPFEGANLLDVIRKVGHDEPVRPRKLNPQIHRDLETIILKCLEKERDRRYANARELTDDLDRFLAHDPIQARPASTIYRLRMKLAKRKAVVATAAIASAALAAALGWWLLVGSPATEHHRLMAAGMKLWDEARVTVVAGGGDADDIRKKSRAAKEGFERALRARDEAEAHLMRGRCLELEGLDEEALKAFERAHALSPTRSEVRVDLAKALFLKYHHSRGLPSASIFSNQTKAGPVVYFADRTPETAEERALRERGERLLADLETTPAQESLLKGLRAMWKGDYARAAHALAAYTKSERWDDQALGLEALCRYFAADFEGSIAVYNRLLSRHPSVVGFVRRGNAKSAGGLRDEAVADFTKAIELDAKDPAAYHNRGIAKHHLGLYDEAIADFTKAIELDSQQAMAYAGRASAKYHKGLFDEAIEDCTKAVALDPKLDQAYANRGLSKSAKGLHAEAIADLSKAIDLNPHSPPIYSNRAFVKGKVGLHDEAIADATKSIELDPKNAEPYSNRGLAKADKGLLDEAIADQTKAIDLDPKFAPYYVYRGRAKRLKGLLDEAIADCTKAIDQDPRYALAYVGRAMSKRAKGLLEEAKADYTKAIEVDSNCIPAYFNRGTLNISMNLYDEAIADYTKILERDAKDADAYANRGFAEMVKGFEEKASADWKRALEVAPPGWSLRADIEDRLRNLEPTRLYREAYRLLEQKQYREGMEKSRNLVENYPKSREAKNSAYNIACGHALLGETKEALDWLEKSVEMGWSNLAHLEKDTDLDSLRGEERYLKLVQALKSK